MHYSTITSYSTDSSLTHRAGKSQLHLTPTGVNNTNCKPKFYITNPTKSPFCRGELTGGKLAATQHRERREGNTDTNKTQTL